MGNTVTKTKVTDQDQDHVVTPEELNEAIADIFSGKRAFPHPTPMPLLETDRMVELNGFKLFVTDDNRLNRRNVVCFSQQAKQWIAEQKLNRDSPSHIMRLMEHKHVFDDVLIVYVRGYY